MQETRCVEGYRVGTPRVTEAMNRHDGGRSTGYFGTGIYFYTNRKGMEKDNSFTKGEQDGWRLMCACKRPLKVSGDVGSWGSHADDLHDLSRDMVRKVRYKKEFADEIDLYPPYYIPECHDEYTEDPAKRKHNYEKCKELLNTAVEKVSKCVEEQGYWNPACDQPINVFLESLGYDCVYPTGEHGHRNDFGGVIFRNTVKKCLGRDLKPGEDITMDKDFERCFLPIKEVPS